MRVSPAPQDCSGPRCRGLGAGECGLTVLGMGGLAGAERRAQAGRPLRLRREADRFPHLSPGPWRRRGLGRMCRHQMLAFSSRRLLPRGFLTFWLSESPHALPRCGFRVPKRSREKPLGPRRPPACAAAGRVLPRPPRGGSPPKAADAVPHRRVSFTFSRGPFLIPWLGSGDGPAVHAAHAGSSALRARPPACFLFPLPSGKSD